MDTDTRKRIVEDAIRRLGVRQLEALSGFIPMGEVTGEYISSSNLVDCIHTAADEPKSKVIGGVISGLAKTKIQDQLLILPAGKDKNEGMRWVLNKKVISREELKEILLEIPGLNI